MKNILVHEGREWRLVRQKDEFGCVVACLAMITGQSYEAVRDELGGRVARGFSYTGWQDFLARHGYAVQHVWQCDQRTNRARSPWPIRPWAEFHMCAVNAGRGDGSHQVVCLRNGTVLDPAKDELSSLSDCNGIAYMAGVFDVQQTPSFGVEVGARMPFPACTSGEAG